MRQNPRQGAAEPFGAPKVMGRYRCDERLAGDSWLEIHRARVQGLAGFDRMFAVLSLAPGALARRPQAAENLLRAARAAATVQDPRVAAISDSGLCPGSAFVASELVHGVSLRALSAYLHDRASSGGPPPGFALVLAHIGAEIAGALAVVHDNDPPLAHGTLAPAAVMVTSQGGIKLLGLGLAASVLTPAEIAAHTGRGPFAAPELAAGEPVTPAADMFALGAILIALGDGNLRARPTDRAVAETIAPLQPLLAAMTAAAPADRPRAAETEAGFREWLVQSRATDVRGELGSLVRATMQAGPLPGADDEDTDPTGADGRAVAITPATGGIDPAAPEAFADEPTAILNVSNDGKSNPLASLLRDMQSHGEPQAVEDTTARTRIPIVFRGEPGRNHNTPTPQNLPTMPATGSSSFEHEARTVMTSATNLPVPQPHPDTPLPTRQTDAVTGPHPGTIRNGAPPAGSGPISARPSAAATPAPTTATISPAADLPTGAAAPKGSPSSGTPVNELQNLTTAEISASLSTPMDPAGQSSTGEDMELSVLAARFKIPAVTPPSWQPMGDLEGSTGGAERPGSLGGIELRPRRRAPRALALAIAGGALCVGAAATVIVLRSQRPAAPIVAAGSEQPFAATAPAGAAPAGPDIQPLVPHAQAPEGPSPAIGKKPPAAATAAGAAPAAAGVPSPSPAAATAPAVPTPAVAPAAATAPTTSPPAPSAAGTTPAPAAALPAQIEVRTVPAGATVWLAGKARGTTPVTLAIPPEARELRLVRPGFETRVVPLEATTPKTLDEELVPTRAPLWGEAQVNIECREKVRMPVLIDGREIGLLCPTGFIGLSPGPHELGVLDPATGARHVITVSLSKGQKRFRLPASSR